MNIIAPIIAIDGPAASGKGTLARKLAEHYGFAHLDTGGLYRAIGLGVLRAGGDPEKEADALKAVDGLSSFNLKDPELKRESTGAAASLVAALPAVRQALVQYQRAFAQTPPDGKKGAVIDGRDIGTVICPDADAKIYIIADVKIRAKRRFLEEFGENDSPENYDKILDDLKARDQRDMTRAVSPLKPAENAYLLDTTNSSIEAVFEAALAHVSDRIAKT